MFYSLYMHSCLITTLTTLIITNSEPIRGHSKEHIYVYIIWQMPLYQSVLQSLSKTPPHTSTSRSGSNHVRKPLVQPGGLAWMDCKTKLFCPLKLKTHQYNVSILAFTPNYLLLTKTVREANFGIHKQTVPATKQKIPMVFESKFFFAETIDLCIYRRSSAVIEKLHVKYSF